MHDERLLKFSAAIRQSYQFSTDTFEYFWGFVPDKTACESVTVDDMQRSKFVITDETIRAQIVARLAEISDDYPEIRFNDLDIADFSIIPTNWGGYWVGFAYGVNVICKVKQGDNFSDDEIMDKVRYIVFDRCEMRLH